MDCVVFFDDVLVPWERVFVLGDVDLINNTAMTTHSAAHTAHQGAAKNLAKCEFVLGVALHMTETLGNAHLPHSEERLAELTMYTELMRACIRSAEADATLDEWGVMCPVPLQIELTRNLFMTAYPRMAEILELLGSSSFMIVPSEADFQSPVAPDIEQYLATATPEEVGLSRERLARIAPALARQIEAKSFPGAVAIVARKGRIAYFEAIGQLDPKSARPKSKDAIFRLYSMTKPFTSVAAMMLVEEGRLRLTDPVGMYLPQLGKLEVLTPSTDASGKTTYTTVAAQRPVTVYDLLRHTSGMVYGVFTSNAELKDLYAKANVAWSGVTPAEQLEGLGKVPLAREPGTMWEYGMSTDVVGRVVEAVTGSTLSRFLDERVFRPLRMKDTTFHVQAGQVKRLAQPFETDRATGQPITLLDVTA